MLHIESHAIIYLSSFDFGDVDWHIYGTDYPVIPIVNGVLDVIAGRVNKHAAVVPSSRFHSGILVNGTQRFELSVANVYSVLGQ